MPPKVNVYKLGRMPYMRTLGIQKKLFSKLKENNNAGSSLLIVEHDPVYTFGLRSKLYDSNYVTKLNETLTRNKLTADVVGTDRGGLITFHGPGQLVVYPIIYLGDFPKAIRSRSIKEYVRLLEVTMIDSLSQIGVKGAHVVHEYPGVWLADGRRKIGFVGITCRRYVTMHGIAINCNCDLKWFDHIDSCGITDRAITSVHHELTSMTHSGEIQPTEIRSFSGVEMKPEPPSIDVCKLSTSFCESFSEHFKCTLRDELLPKSSLEEEREEEDT